MSGKVEKELDFMINDQDKRAIETMAQCGCDFDAFCSMFPKVSREDIVAI